MLPHPVMKYTKIKLSMIEINIFEYIELEKNRYI